MRYSKNILITGLSLLALIFLIGCAELNNGLKSEKKDPLFEKWTTLAESSQGHSPKAKEISSTILKKKQETSLSSAETAMKKLPERPINLTMRKAELKTVLRAMAKAVSLNILVKNDLPGDINVDFHGVAWDKAFTGLLNTYGLSYVWEGNIIRIMTIEDAKRDLDRKKQLREIQSVEPLLEPVVIGIDYADVKKLGETLKDFLNKDIDGKTRGSVKVDEHSNSLIISATHEELSRILPIIEKLDKPTSQILIKANIVETTKGVARDLGIMWGGYNKGTNVSGNNDFIVTGGSVSPSGSLGAEGLGINFPSSNISSSTASGSLGLLFGKVGGNLLEVQLQALQSDNKLNILSSPSITTLDNQKAYTENGERVPFVTLSSSSGSTPTQTTTFQDVVLRLEITPHVIDGKNLKMTILVKKDEVDTTRKDSLGDPYIIKKQTETVLIVQDGETIVISGLTKQTNKGSGDGVPWLKDIPYLGWAFKSDSKSDSMEEVLIFITPHILPVGNSQNLSVAGDK